MNDTYTYSLSFSDAQLQDIIGLKNSGYTWEEVAASINSKFNLEKSTESVRHAFRRYGETVDSTVDEEEFNINHFKKLARSTTAKSIAVKENKLLLKYLSANEEIIDQVKEAIKSSTIKKVILPKLPKSPNKRNLTLELMISDIHYGKKTENFDLEIARERMKGLTSVVLKEIKSNSRQFTVERLIIALLGDLIESYTMHGIESSHACEFGNSRQIQAAIDSLYTDLIYPLAMTGIKIDVPCVTGNHDRTERERTMINPGEANVTWIIYKTLQLLCKQAGFKNVTFYIPEGPYATLDIYGNSVLYEHGDNAKSTTRIALEKLMNKRSTQLGRLVDFFRIGHFHEYVMYDRGRIIVNESVPGQDSYADVLGFNSYAGQTLNSYIETNERPNCFYKSFPIYLE